MPFRRVGALVFLAAVLSAPGALGEAEAPPSRPPRFPGVPLPDSELAFTRGGLAPLEGPTALTQPGAAAASPSDPEASLPPPWRASFESTNRPPLPGPRFGRTDPSAAGYGLHLRVENPVTKVLSPHHHAGTLGRAANRK